MQQHHQARTGARHGSTQGPIAHQLPCRAAPVRVCGDVAHPRKYVASGYTALPLNGWGLCVVTTMAEGVLGASAKLADAEAAMAHTDEQPTEPEGRLQGKAPTTATRPRTQHPQGQEPTLGGRSGTPVSPQDHHVRIGQPHRRAGQPAVPHGPIALSSWELQLQPQSPFEVNDPRSSLASLSTEVEIVEVTPRSYSPSNRAASKEPGGPASPPLVIIGDDPATPTTAKQGEAPAKRRKRVHGEQIADRTRKRRPNALEPNAAALASNRSPEREGRSASACTPGSGSPSPSIAMAARKEQVDLDLAIELLTEYREQGHNRDPDVAKRIAQMLTSDYQMLKERERGRRRRAGAKIELNMLDEEERQQKIQEQRTKRQAYRARSRTESSQGQPNSAASSTGSYPRSVSLESENRTGSSTPETPQPTLTGDVQRPAPGAIRRQRRRKFCSTSTSSGEGTGAVDPERSASPSIISTAPSIEILPEGEGGIPWAPTGVRSSLATHVNAGAVASGSVTQVHGIVTSDGVISVTESAATVTLSMSEDGSVVFTRGSFVTTESHRGPRSPTLEALLAEVEESEATLDTAGAQGEWLNDLLRIGEACRATPSRTRPSMADL
ncbi:hypothetical protein QAD02_023760 [Eretmocerus hayati]|uniref:Uncharacterized protein n=1 Tax=Eretmocerus hayati TaxID=131215 RepID=A0ACC2PX24_9HYME|nr:hypothetical protein QAD02_023760 [Eretmocerus hayati]